MGRKSQANKFGDVVRLQFFMGQIETGKSLNPHLNFLICLSFRQGKYNFPSRGCSFADHDKNTTAQEFADSFFSMEFYDHLVELMIRSTLKGFAPKCRSLKCEEFGKFHHGVFFTQSPLEDPNLTSTISRKHGFFHRMKHFWSTFFFNLLKKSVDLGSGFHLSSVVLL